MTIYELSNFNFWINPIICEGDLEAVGLAFALSQNLFTFFFKKKVC